MQTFTWYSSPARISSTARSTADRWSAAGGAVKGPAVHPGILGVLGGEGGPPGGQALREGRLAAVHDQRFEAPPAGGEADDMVVEGER